MLRIEIRPGEGGDDAVVFARQLTDTIVAWAHHLGHPVIRNTDSSRQVVVEVQGSLDNYEQLAGVHRIQRVPSNDHRRHTSTATVAVLPGTTCREPELHERDLSIQAFRGSGPGGQHRNKTATAIRLTHIPTGLTVEAQDSRSQYQNLEAARRRLMQRLVRDGLEQHTEQRQALRGAQVGTAERPTKTFTHRETGDRASVIDHHTGRRWRLDDFRRGRLDRGR